MPDEIVYEATKFKVAHRRFFCAGREHSYEVVLHPGAAVILPVLADGRIVLIHNVRPAVDAELLEIPAGTLDPGELPADCAARELAEETGYRAGRCEPLCAFYSTPGILNERMHLFIATELEPGPTALEDTEQIRVTAMTLDEALAGIPAGRIVDGKTIVALLYYDRFIRSPERPA